MSDGDLVSIFFAKNAHLMWEVWFQDGSCISSKARRAWARWGWPCTPCPLSASSGPSPSSQGCSRGGPCNIGYSSVLGIFLHYLLGGFPSLVAGCLMWWVPKALMYLRLCSWTSANDSSFESFRKELYSFPTSSWNVMCLDCDCSDYDAASFDYLSM